MGKKTTSILSNKILERIPPGVNSFDYLTEALSLSRESVYRRLRGIIPFTFEEILNLSTKLDISMDDLLKGDKAEKAIFNLENNMLSGVGDDYIEVFRSYCDEMEVLSKAKSNQIIISVNRILSVFTCPFENLFKFYYYKWLHQFGETPLNYYFSDVSIPDELNELRIKGANYSNIQDVTIISDRNMFYNTIQEIKYYSDRDLITPDEIRLIKQDIMSFVEGFYQFSLNGISGNGARYEVYLSSLNIENNTSYVVCDDKVSCSYWIHSDNNVYSFDPELCMLQKDWLDSLKKYSVLISHSNQKMQAELLSDILKQLELLPE